MGADFLLAWLPKCQMTNERIDELRDIINDSATDVSEIDCDIPEAVANTNPKLATLRRRKVVLSALATYVEHLEAESLLATSPDGMFMTTGGETWGTPPSTLYTAMNTLSWCNNVYTKLMAYRQEDRLEAHKLNETDLIGTLRNGNIIASGWLDHDDPDKQDIGDYIRIDDAKGNEIAYLESSDLVGADVTTIRKKLQEILQACRC